MLLPKRKRFLNKKHLQFVASHPCCLQTINEDRCQGFVQAHHLLRPYEGYRGMGMRASDNNSVPLCQYHHARLHDGFGDEDKFWDYHGLIHDYGRNYAKLLYINFLINNSN